MKRICAVLAAVCLLGFALAGCGSSAKFDVKAVASKVEAVAAIENPKDFVEDDLVYDMSIAKENVVEFAGQHTLTNGKSGAVLVVHAKSGQISTIKKQLEAYRDGIVATWENYKSDFPAGYEQTKSGRVVVKGDYAVLAIAGEGVDYAAVDKTIDAALK